MRLCFFASSVEMMVMYVQWRAFDVSIWKRKKLSCVAVMTELLKNAVWCSVSPFSILVQGRLSVRKLQQSQPN